MAVLVTGEGPQVNTFEQISPLLLKSGRVGYPGHMYGVPETLTPKDPKTPLTLDL